MKEVVHTKLVRDLIPAIVVADNATPVTRILNDDEYRLELLKKLVEEAKELLESDGDLSERADVAEVLKALDSVLGFSRDVIEKARNEKAVKRGGFEQKIFLEKVITDD